MTTLTFFRLHQVFLNITRSPYLTWAVLFILIVLVRLPYLLGEHLFFDGDEAVLGIMARDLINGVNFPVYFYGQRYGFSLPEVLAAALFTPFLGSTVYTLKLAALLIYSIVLKNFSDLLLANKVRLSIYLFAIITMACFPTWLIWATKLRGGYLSALLFSSFIAKEIFSTQELSRKNWLRIAVCAAFVTVSQVLFLVPLIPLLLERFFRLKSRRDYLITLFTGTATFMLLRIPAYLNSEIWKTSFLGFHSSHYKAYFIDGFWSHYTNYFLYGDKYEVPLALKIKAILFFVLLIIISLICLLKLRNKSRQTILWLLLGIFLSSFAVQFFKPTGGRYLLPFYTGIMLLVLQLVISLNSVAVRLPQLFIALMALLTLSSTVHYNSQFISYWLEPKVNDMNCLNDLMSELKKREIKHLISSDWFLFWQINYLGNEEINCRFLDREDRVNRFTERVDACYLDPNCKIALVGGHWPLLDMQTVAGWNDSIEKINERYYLYEHPAEKFLNKAGYQLPRK